MSSIDAPLPAGGALTRSLPRPRGLLLLTLGRLVRNPAGAFGLGAITLLFLIAIFAPLVAPYDPLEQDGRAELMGPSSAHLFGTDELGRDLLSRVIYGSRTSLMVGVLAVTLGSLIGVSTGLAAGYVGGWLDTAIMRLWDVLLAFPAILIGIAIAAMLGPGATNAAIALAIVSIPQFSRITRASVLGEKQRDYVQAARSIGVRDIGIALRHILPNTVSPFLVQLSLAMGYAVLLEAGLSFLGLGTQPPNPSWGGMLNASRTYLRDAPYYAIFPGIALSILLLGLNFLSDALRDALDPKLTHLR
ncbi:MAG: ABC transporter permease [Thermomicrobiales bacterium]